MQIELTAYEVFYQKICEAFVKKYWNGQKPAGSQSIRSRKIWNKKYETGEYRGRYISSVKFAGNSDNQSHEYFYRVKGFIKDDREYDVDDIWMFNGLIELGYELLEDFPEISKKEDQTKHLWDQFIEDNKAELNLQSKVGTTDLITLSSIKFDLQDNKHPLSISYNILIKFFRNLRERQYEKAWQLVNHMVRPIFPPVGEYLQFKDYYDVPIRNVYIFNGVESPAGQYITWEVFYERRATDFESFYHYIYYWDGRRPEYDMIVDAFDEIFQNNSSKYKQWSLLRKEDLELIWNECRINKNNIAELIPFVNDYYIKVFCRFEFFKSGDEWEIHDIETENAKFTPYRPF